MGTVGMVPLEGQRLQALSADDGTTTVQLEETQGQMKLTCCSCCEHLRPIVMGFVVASVIVNMFVVAQGMPGGLPGYMAVPGAVVAGVGCMSALLGVLALRSGKPHLVAAFAITITVLGAFEFVRACVDLATALAWCNSFCLLGTTQGRCTNGADYCVQQI